MAVLRGVIRLRGGFLGLKLAQRGEQKGGCSTSSQHGINTYCWWPGLETFNSGIRLACVSFLKMIRRENVEREISF